MYLVAKKPNTKKSDDVTHRHNYIEGAGQLCIECGQRNNKEAEHAHQLWKSAIDID